MQQQPRVPVVSIDGTPLMPTTPGNARKMLRDGLARPRRNKLGLFYIQMIRPVGAITQPMFLALDQGGKYEGVAVA
ncbi:MAG: RRXRR domain-containing protein, partial [Dethiobacter sp.]|nr:RRXRR domain-containing protein [Dethiobacter sp.]